jgi:hypothetical protein
MTLKNFIIIKCHVLEFLGETRFRGFAWRGAIAISHQRGLLDGDPPLAGPFFV